MAREAAKNKAVDIRAQLDEVMAAMKTLDANHSKELAKIEERHVEEMAKRKEIHGIEVNAMVQRHGTEITALATPHLKEHTDFNETHAGVTDCHAKKLEELREELLWLQSKQVSSVKTYGLYSVVISLTLPLLG